MRRRQRPRLALLTCVLAAGLGLLGCGGDAVGPASPIADDTTAEEILAKSRTAAKAASSFRLAGEIRQNGDTIELDLRFQKDKGVQGTVGIQDMTFEVVVIDRTAYLKADRETWAQAGAGQGAQLLVGKYIQISNDTAGFSDIMRVADPARLLDESLTAAGTVTKGEVKQVNGVQAVALTEDGSADQGILYVSLQGEPYPVRVEGPSDEGAVDFTDWNVPVELTAPPADQIISFDELEQAADAA